MIIVQNMYKSNLDMGIIEIPFQNFVIYRLTVFPHEEDLLFMISCIQNGLKSVGPSRTQRTRVRLFTVLIASAKKSQFLDTPDAELPIARGK